MTEDEKVGVAVTLKDLFSLIVMQPDSKVQCLG
jgi:hypothetical protein